MGKSIALNAVGVGLAAVTGVGFSYRSKNKAPIPIPEAERLKLVMPRIQKRIAEREKANQIYLHRGEDVQGPFQVSQLSKL